MKDFDGEFSTDYQKNLEMLSDKIICAKLYRNKICGYITRSIKLKLASEVVESEVTAEVKSEVTAEVESETVSHSIDTAVNSKSTDIKKSDSSN